MRNTTRKLTTAAVCTALAVIMCVCTAYLPFSFMPLYVAAFCIFLACKRGSILYGALSALATIGIMFAMTGLSVSWFMLVIMFAPYGVLCFFMHRFGYFRLKTGLIRGAVMIAFFNLTMAAVYLIATHVLTAGIDIPVTAWVETLGGYWLLAILGTVVLLPLDLMLSLMSGIVLKRIPGGEKDCRPSSQAPKNMPGADEIFGDGAETENADESGLDKKNDA